VSRPLLELNPVCSLDLLARAQIPCLTTAMLWETAPFPKDHTKISPPPKTTSMPLQTLSTGSNKKLLSLHPIHQSKRSWTAKLTKTMLEFNIHFDHLDFRWQLPILCPPQSPQPVLSHQWPLRSQGTSPIFTHFLPFPLPPFYSG
jgi:hypothetical protein